MFIDAKSERALIDRKLILECFQIALTRKSKSNPLKFSGPGCIYYDDQGDLRIKLYDRTKKSSHRNMLSLFLSSKIGLVPEEDYFKLKAKDDKGNIWTAERIHLNNSSTTTPFGTVLKIKLNNLSCTRIKKTKAEYYHGEVVIRDKRQLPFNKFVDNANGSSSLRGLEFTLSDLVVDIEQREDNIRIFLESKTKKITIQTIRKFLDAFSIASGEQSELVYTQITHDNKTSTAVYNSRKTSAFTLPSIASMQYHEPQQLQGFIDAFIACPNGLLASLLTFWRRLTESSSYSETAALVLCINIEGMVKQYIPAEKSSDNQLAEQIKVAKKAIKSLKLNEKINTRVMQTISELDKQGIGARLKSMAASGTVTSDQVSAWISLRNSTAHADLLGSGGTNIINFYNNQTLCIDLFYCLICWTIKYVGPRSDVLKRLMPLPNDAGEDGAMLSSLPNDSKMAAPSL